MIRLVACLLVPTFVACGGSQQRTDEHEGAGERAGKKLDEAAAEVKETGDEVGEKVGEKLGGAGEDVKEKLGLDDQPADAGAPTPATDGG